MGQGDQITYCNRQKIDITRTKLASVSITKIYITVTVGIPWE